MQTRRSANLSFDTDEQIDARKTIVGANECQRLSRDIIPIEEEEAQWLESANWVPYIYYSILKGHAFAEGALF